MAVEWLSQNIGAFGGDPSKITLWGQSAGASAADMYLFAYPDNPLVRATVSSSGVAVGRALNVDFGGSNFSFVARAMGCGFDDDDDDDGKRELECMRRVPYTRIENFVGGYQDNSTLVNTSQPAISFTRRRECWSFFCFADCMDGCPLTTRNPLCSPSRQQVCLFQLPSRLCRQPHCASAQASGHNCSRSFCPCRLPHPQLHRRAMGSSCDNQHPQHSLCRTQHVCAPQQPLSERHGPQSQSQDVALPVGWELFGFDWWRAVAGSISL